MHWLEVVCIVLLFAKGLSEDLSDLNLRQLLELGGDVTKLIQNDFLPSDVSFYLVTPENPQKSIIIDESNIQRILGTTKTTKFLIHGWLENHRRSWYNEIASEFLKTMDVNIVEVDWERLARLDYLTSASVACRFVGNQIASFVQKSNIPPAELHLIGHSLGAHVAGFAAKQITKNTDGEKVRRITALDPAGPYFREYVVYPQNRLDKNDAKIVDVLHTDAGFNGYELPIGTFDIYVNGGKRSQPGCLDIRNYSSLGEIIQLSFCSHARSHEYFEEWINTGKFECRICSLATVWLGENCIPHETLMLSEEDINENIDGICFTNTNSEKPYLTMA